MKQALVFFCLVVAIGFIAVVSNQKPATSDWSHWMDQTQSLFEGSGELFSNFTRDREAASEDKQLANPSSDNLDEQLQALLPPERLNLRVDPMTLEDKEIPLEAAAADSQFSDMFEPRVKDQKPALKGKLHTDENNEIIGAEMHLAIPTN